MYQTLYFRCSENFTMLLVFAHVECIKTTFKHCIITKIILNVYLSPSIQKVKLIIQIYYTETAIYQVFISLNLDCYGVKLLESQNSMSPKSQNCENIRRWVLSVSHTNWLINSKQRRRFPDHLSDLSLWFRRLHLHQEGCWVHRRWSLTLCQRAKGRC